MTANKLAPNAKLIELLTVLSIMAVVYIVWMVQPAPVDDWNAHNRWEWTELLMSGQRFRYFF